MDKKITLLIAEDEASIRNGIATAIHWDEYNIEVIGLAKDGQEAIDFITKNTPDIVITDIQMPKFTGLEVIEQSRTLGLEIEFIILSGFNDFQYAQAAIQNHVGAYLLKPIRTSDLLKEITTACDKLLQRRNHDLVMEQQQFQAEKMNAFLVEKFFTDLAASKYKNETVAQSAYAKISNACISLPVVPVMFKFILPDRIDLKHFSKQDEEIFKIAIKNVVEELLSHKVYIFYQLQNRLGLIIPMMPDLSQKLSQCMLRLEQMCELNIAAGLGTASHSFMSLAAACKNAQELVEYHIYGSESKLFHTALLETKSTAVPVAEINLQPLRQAVVETNVTEIQAQTANFIQTLLYIPMPPPEYLRGMCVFALHDIEHKIAECTQSSVAEFIKPHALILQEKNQLTDIQLYLQCEFMQLAQHLQTYQKNVASNPTQQIKRYIDEHIFTKLRLEDIAAQVFLSEGYVASCFKKDTGVTLRAYILEKRMKKAKELLLLKQYSVSEIAEQLQYEDYRCFSRAFKSYYHTSPTEYLTQSLLFKEEIQSIQSTQAQSGKQL